MKLSIGMCTYNGARYLQEQLASIAAQTRLPDELVVCDDCSSDGTRAILEEFKARVTFPCAPLLQRAEFEGVEKLREGD